MNGYGWFGSMAFCLLWLIFLFVAFIFFVRLLRHHDHGSMYKNRNEPLDIVKDRYAKGEITKEQFEQLKKDLK
jgi:putative membrane protein